MHEEGRRHICLLIFCPSPSYTPTFEYVTPPSSTHNGCTLTRDAMAPQRPGRHSLGELLVLLEGLRGGGKLRLLLEQLGLQSFHGDRRDAFSCSRRRESRLSCSKEINGMLGLWLSCERVMFCSRFVREMIRYHFSFPISI